MPTQTQNAPPQNTPPPTATPTGGLDPAGVNLTKAIRQTESGGDFQAKGKSGEYGAYQFLPDTWAKYSAEAGVNVPLQQATPEQQNEVAYKKIESWKNQGYNVGQIASMWNAGEGAPNAYQENNIGTNSSGVQYNTPAYAKKVALAYQEYKTGTAPSDEVLGTNTTSSGNSNSLMDTVKSIANFAFPIAGDIGAALQGKTDKTALQQLGDAGLSALWFIPGVGEAGEAGIDAARLSGVLGETGSKVAGQALGGAGLGYGADVASKLSQGQTGAGVLAPGLGTLTGGVLGGGGAALGSALEGTGGRVVNSLVKPLQKDFAYGKNPGRAVAEEGITGNTMQELADNVTTTRQKVGTQLGALGDMFSQGQLKLQLGDTLAPIDEAMKTAASANNSTLVSRLQEVKTALTQNLGIGTDEAGNAVIASKGARNLADLSYNDAQQFKDHVSSMTNWTGRASDDKAVNAALQDVYRGVTKAQQDGVEQLPSIGASSLSQLKKLNQRYGDLTQAQVALKHRLAVEERQNLIGFKTGIYGMAAGGLGQLVSGNPLTAVLSGLAGAGAEAALGSTAVKTRLASGLARLGGAESVLGTREASAGRGAIPSLIKKGLVRVAANQ